jgi:hypothetical protein
LRTPAKLGVPLGRREFGLAAGTSRRGRIVEAVFGDEYRLDVPSGDAEVVR